MAADNSTALHLCKGCGQYKTDAETCFQWKNDRGPRRKVRRCCWECLRRKNRAYHHKIKDDPERSQRYLQRRRDQRRQMSYGVTPEQYAVMLEQQQGVCAICRKPETFRQPKTGPIAPLAVDHDHETGKVRGLLCHACNVGISRFNDDPAILAAAASYLREHAEVT